MGWVGGCVYGWLGAFSVSVSDSPTLPVSFHGFKSEEESTRRYEMRAFEDAMWDAKRKGAWLSGWLGGLGPRHLDRQPCGHRRAETPERQAQTPPTKYPHADPYNALQREHTHGDPRHRARRAL